MWIFVSHWLYRAAIGLTFKRVIIMEEKLDQVQQVVDENKNFGVDKIIANPILCKELIAELRANRKATEELTAKTWELITTLNTVYHLAVG